MNAPAFPRLLYRLTVGLSFLLFLLVALAPLVDNGATGPDAVGRSVALFAHDVPLRRTALASSIGLLVTASVFFRTSDAGSSARKSLSSTATPPPVVGA